MRSNDRRFVLSYDRQSVGQTGGGHFSPIAGYNRERDMALVLDVAQFKYPPHWVPVHDLYRATLNCDADTQKSRGYYIIEAK